MRLFVGDHWAEDHHDIELMTARAAGWPKARLPEGVAGMAYFGTATYGYLVEVTGSDVALSSADGEIYDWAMGWDQWQALSALC